MIPKQHGKYLHEIDDDSLADLLPVAKKVAKALGAGDSMANYNLLQNNGSLAHQVVIQVKRLSMFIFT